jgi:hypothetical protein
MSPQAGIVGVGLSREAPAAAQLAWSCCATALRRGVGGRRIRVTIVRSIRTRRPSTDVGVLAPTARASGHRDREREREERRCKRRRSGASGLASAFGFPASRARMREARFVQLREAATSGPRAVTDRDDRRRSTPIQRAPRGVPARGGPWAARCSGPAPWSGGWVGPEVTAARPSRAQDVRISTFLLVLEGARAAFNDAALGPGGCALNGRERPWRQRALGASAPRECVARVGADRALWGRVRLAPVRSCRSRARRRGRGDCRLAKRKRDAGLGLCGCSTPAATTQCRRVAPRLRRWRRVPRCPATRVVLGADLAVQLRRLRFQDLGDLNERYQARVGQIEGQQSPIVLALASHGAPNRALQS